MYLTVSMYDDPTETFTTHYSKCKDFITQAHASGGNISRDFLHNLYM